MSYSEGISLSPPDAMSHTNITADPRAIMGIATPMTTAAITTIIIDREAGYAMRSLSWSVDIHMMLPTKSMTP